jgi:hypothetical protein
MGYIEGTGGSPLKESHPAIKAECPLNRIVLAYTEDSGGSLLKEWLTPAIEVECLLNRQQCWLTPGEPPLWGDPPWHYTTTLIILFFT